MPLVGYGRAARGVDMAVHEVVTEGRIGDRDVEPKYLGWRFDMILEFVVDQSGGRNPGR